MSNGNGTPTGPTSDGSIAHLVGDLYFTPTETRILRVLSDGLCHTSKELISCLADAEGGEEGTVRAHLTNIRSKMRKRGQDIVSVNGWGTTAYRWVRLLYSSNE